MQLSIGSLKTAIEEEWNKKFNITPLFAHSFAM